MMERADEPSKLGALYGAVSKAGSNEAWARLVLLSLVRSEIAADLLTKASNSCLPTGQNYFATSSELSSPSKASPPTSTTQQWASMPKIYPLELMSRLALPGRGSFFGFSRPVLEYRHQQSLTSSRSISTGRSFGQEKTSLPLQSLRGSIIGFQRWTGLSIVPPGEQRARPFNGELTSSQLASLREELTTGFLLFCNHVPHHAVEYLKALAKHPYPDQAFRALMKFRGALAQAAPKELAELTSAYLMPQRDENEEDENDGGPFREAFGHRELDFVPVSPAQGPFYELLLHAPDRGLALIRQVVDHAVAFKSGGKEFGSNAITVLYADGIQKVFSWYQTYNWSRDVGAGPPVVTSALMALKLGLTGGSRKANLSKT